MQKNNRLYSYKMVLPALFMYILLFIIPTVIGLYYAMTDWTIGKDRIQFIGFQNILYIFHDEELVRAINNTLIFTVLTVVFKNGLGLLLALAVNMKIAARNFLRVTFYMPAVFSSIVIGLIFVPILHPTGILNTFLGQLGLHFLAQKWLVDAKIVMMTISAVGIWQWTGYHMVIYLAGLQSISTEYYEAALIDGATSGQKLRYITIPLLAPSININIMLCIIGGLKVFSEVYALTNGGPGNTSQVIALEIFKKFGEGRWGLGTALNLVLVICISIICIPLLQKMRRMEVEG